MYRTFNMGIGLAIVISKKDVGRLMKHFKSKRIKFYQIGEVINNKKRKIIL